MEFGFGVLPEFADRGFQCGIRGFVESDAGADTIEVDARKCTMEDDAIVFDFPNGRTLFEIAVFSGIENDSVSCFEWGILSGRWSVQTDPTVLSFDDCSDEGSTFFSKLSVGEIGMVSSCEPTGC